VEPVVQNMGSGSNSSSKAFEPPAYGHRQGFIPRAIDDFGDGGAFPEIHVIQHPLNMGKKDSQMVPVSGVTQLQVDAEGNIKYDVVVRQGQRKDKTIASTFADLTEKFEDQSALQRPSAEEELKIAEKTRAALQLSATEKLAAAQPQFAKHSTEPTFIRYTPSNQNEEFNSGAKQRIIRLQAAPVDPL